MRHAWARSALGLVILATVACSADPSSKTPTAARKGPSTPPSTTLPPSHYVGAEFVDHPPGVRVLSGSPLQEDSPLHYAELVVTDAGAELWHTAEIGRVARWPDGRVEPLPPPTERLVHVAARASGLRATPPSVPCLPRDTILVEVDGATAEVMTEANGVRLSGARCLRDGVVTVTAWVPAGAAPGAVQDCTDQIRSLLLRDPEPGECERIAQEIGAVIHRPATARVPLVAGEDLARWRVVDAVRINLDPGGTLPDWCDSTPDGDPPIGVVDPASTDPEHLRPLRTFAFDRLTGRIREISSVGITCGTYDPGD